MNTLKELIEGGEYELAAYRLVYGVLKTQIRESSVRRYSLESSRTVSSVGKKGAKERVSDDKA